VLNDEINAAREVTKTDALRLHTFQSRGYGVLGVVDRDRVVFFRQPVKRHTAKSEFDIGTVKALPRVDVILVYQDAPGDLIEAAVDNGAKGLVIAGAGAGATSGTQRKGMVYAASKGVCVVTSTRTGAGGLRPSGGRRQAGARSRTPTASADAARPGRQTERGPVEFFVAARTRAGEGAHLLMLALAKTSDPTEIQRMFTEY